MVAKIIIPCYNAENYINQCIKSLQAQDETSFEVAIVNDASTDDTQKVAGKAIGTDGRFCIIEKDENGGPLSSLVTGIKYLDPKDSDTIAVIDGDDLLITSHALSLVKQTYEKHDCLITYGSFATASGRQYPDTGKRYSHETITQRSYRTAPWRASHLRTFRHYLWRNIKDQDLRDPSGRYWKAATDLAAMFPMLEMAGERQQALQERIYGYRDNLTTNQHQTNRPRQLENERLIRSMKAYAVLG